MVPPGCVGVIDAAEFNGRTGGVVTTLPAGTHVVELVGGKLIQVLTAQVCQAFQNAQADYHNASGGRAPRTIERPPNCQAP